MLHQCKIRVEAPSWNITKLQSLVLLYRDLFLKQAESSRWTAMRLDLTCSAWLQTAATKVSKRLTGSDPTAEPSIICSEHGGLQPRELTAVSSGAFQNNFSQPACNLLLKPFGFKFWKIEWLNVANLSNVITTPFRIQMKQYIWRSCEVNTV